MFRERMEELVSSGSFIENATFSGNMYGTSKEAVQHVLDTGQCTVQQGGGTACTGYKSVYCT